MNKTKKSAKKAPSTKKAKKLEQSTYKTGDIDISCLFKLFGIKRMSTQSEALFSTIFEYWMKHNLTKAEIEALRLRYGTKRTFEKPVEDNNPLTKGQKERAKKLEKAIDTIGTSLKDGYLKEARKVLRQGKISLPVKDSKQWETKIKNLISQSAVDKIKEASAQMKKNPYECALHDMSELYGIYKDPEIAQKIYDQRFEECQKQRLDSYRCALLLKGTTKGCVLLDVKDLFDDEWNILGIEYDLWEGNSDKFLKLCYRSLMNL
jgi:hypothetical protein